jgi:hypothetical protein
MVKIVHPTEIKVKVCSPADLLRYSLSRPINAPTAVEDIILTKSSLVKMRSKSI